MCVNLLQGFCKVASRHHSCADLVKADVVLALEVFDAPDMPPKAVVFVFFILLSGRSGPNAATQTFVLMDLDVGVPLPSAFERIVLTLR